MIRASHPWPGILAALLVMILTLSGAVRSLYPAAERLVAHQAEAGPPMADPAGRIAASHPGLEQIRRAASGRVTAYCFNGGIPRLAVIDPATGQDAGSADPDPLERWLTNLHRSLFLGDAGRIATALRAEAMLVLALSGAAETVLLVGSEGGSTWGFASTLHAALIEAGQRVHVAPMAGFDPSRYHRALYHPCRDLWRGLCPGLGAGVPRPAGTDRARPRRRLRFWASATAAFPPSAPMPRRL